MEKSGDTQFECLCHLTKLFKTNDSFKSYVHFCSIAADVTQDTLFSAQVKNLTEQLRTTNQNIPKSQYSLAQNMEQLPKITNLLVNQYSWLSDTSTVNVS